MPNNIKRVVAKWVMNQYDLDPVISIEKNMDCDGMYIPDQDKVLLSEKLKPELLIKTVLHEAKHVMDAMKYGRAKIQKKYNQAGTVAANYGDDPYKDNKWELRAEKFAEQEMKTKWKDLYNGNSEED